MSLYLPTPVVVEREADITLTDKGIHNLITQRWVVKVDGSIVFLSNNYHLAYETWVELTGKEPIMRY